MAMDFFEHQDRARRNTGRLVLLFIAAIIGIIALTYPVIAIAVLMLTRGSGGPGGPGGIWQPELLFVVTAAVLAIVTVGSLYKLAQLRGGGRVVAESLGGRRIDSGSTDPDERKLLNVVQEMAIASGVPVPPVYLMHDENGINAFAAGFNPDDAVIGVTRGCVQLLDRDELQGVIAHEFSHILNGDMRLNIRLIGVLHGILVIAFIGQMIFRTLLHTGGGRRRSSSSNKKDGGGIIVVIAAAAALMAIGYVGYFFGGLIKAAVSRQREYLADASAVQFTRYPKGIGGALSKIGGYAYGSTVTSPRASEISHMFFGQGVKSWLGAATATHPPLPERIRRIDADWGGSFIDTGEIARSKRYDTPQANEATSGFAHPQPIAALTGLVGAAQSANQAQDNAIDLLGSLSDQHLNYAHDLINAMPDVLTEAAHSSFGACAVIYALLMDADEEIAARQIETISGLVGQPIAEATKKLRLAVTNLDTSARLPLVDMAMPALHEMSSDQYAGFKKCIRELVAEDRKIELFEWTLSYILIRRLAPAYEPDRRIDPRVRYYSLKPMHQHLSVLLSTLARYGHKDAKDIHVAFDDATARLQLNPAPMLLADSVCGLKELSHALQALNEVSIREKKKVIQACAACIVSDHRVTTAEGEMLRAICDALGCPMPPILPGQPVI